jgi:hypothetical protein
MRNVQCLFLVSSKDQSDEDGQNRILQQEEANSSGLMSRSCYDYCCVGARKQRVTAECLLPPLTPHSRIILPAIRGQFLPLETKYEING